MSIKQLTSLQKQNDGIYKSLTARNIEFKRLIVTDKMEVSEIIMILKDENTQLKTIAKLHKPSKQKKKRKAGAVKTGAVKPDAVKPDAVKSAIPVDEVIAYKPITSNREMEVIKRVFFNESIEDFTNLCSNYTFQYYHLRYRFASDNDMKPKYIAGNLVGGLVKQLEEFKQFLFGVARCEVSLHPGNGTTYLYDFYTILNTQHNIQDVLGSLLDDYLIEEIELKTIGEQFPKRIDEMVIAEKYLH